MSNRTRAAFLKLSRTMKRLSRGYAEMGNASEAKRCREDAIWYAEHAELQTGIVTHGERK